MNYEKAYQSIISNALSRADLVKYEKHHIVPRCLGGSDDASNLVKLSLREHFVCHLLLAKIHGGGLWHALWMMATSGRYGSRHYETARKRHTSKMMGHIVSEATREKLRKPKSEETKAKMRKPKKDSSKMRKPKTDEHRANISKGQLGRVQTEEAKRKMSESHAGKVLSNEHRENIRKAMTGKKRGPYKCTKNKSASSAHSVNSL